MMFHRWAGVPSAHICFETCTKSSLRSWWTCAGNRGRQTDGEPANLWLVSAPVQRLSSGQLGARSRLSGFAAAIQCGYREPGATVEGNKTGTGNIVIQFLFFFVLQQSVRLFVIAVGHRFLDSRESWCQTLDSHIYGCNHLSHRV